MTTIQQLRLKSYAHAMRQIAGVVALASFWQANLQRLPVVRGLAVADRLAALEALIATAAFHAAQAGLRKASAGLRAKQRELKALKAELELHRTPAADVVVLDDDWGKKGRGAKIIAWIQATGPTAAQVMERFQLAKSTAQAYLRRAKKAAAVAVAA